MTMTSFHKTNFGSFGRYLPCDLDGYVHLTAEGWMTAPVAYGTDGPLTGENLICWAANMAEQAQIATQEAEAQLTEWQESN